MVQVPCPAPSPAILALPPSRERDALPPDERYSPTFLAAFLGCRQATAFDLARRRGEDDAAPAGLDAHGTLITGLGDEHEARVLEALRADGEVVVVARPASDAERPAALDATRAAMDAGASWVHQGALADDPWFGYADFLKRVEVPCASWPWSYEPWDAKLARQPKPAHVLQIAMYAELLDAVQGDAPARMGLMLGGGGDASGAPRARWVEAAFAVADFRHYVRRVADRALGFAAATPDAFAGEPCAACGQCGWHPRCRERWEADDHLSRVAGVTASQRRALVAGGIVTLGTLADLVDLPSADRPPVRMPVDALARLAEQAALQRRTALAADERANGDANGEGGDRDAPTPPAWALLPHRPGLGLDRLPAPDAGDLYFDFEGDPLEPGGLEYLCGVLARDGVDGPFGAGEPVPGGGPTGGPTGDAAGDSGTGTPGYRFRAFWAHDRAAERAAFEALIDAFVAHLEAYPDARLYHYAPYERSAMTRLASMHGTREAELDELLRGERLVDLYRVVREGVRVGASSYSIKQLEPLYMAARATDTGDGGDSVVTYHAWRASGDGALLDDIEAYNVDDCASTALLHGWLLARAAELDRSADAGGVEPVADAPAEDDEGDAERERRERVALEQAEIDALERELTGGLADGAGADDADDPAAATERDARRLVADLLRFHRREAKPEWWAFFERMNGAPEAFVDDADCLGDCAADPSRWGVPEARSHLYAFRFPAQETKLRAGAGAVLHDGSGAGTIVELDERAGTLVLKRGAKIGEPPERLSLMPGGPVPTDALERAVRTVARDVAERRGTFPHLEALLRGEPPRIAGHETGAPLVDPADAADPARLLAATVDAVRGLERSWLCVQGPPGAGKTYTLARVISALIDDGRTVGVSSNSHAAIDNVLAAVERFRAGSGGAPFLGLKNGGGGGPYESPLDEPMVVPYRKSKRGIDPDAVLFGGTAWWFCADDGPRVDTLVVDEAGQVSLGHLVGTAAAASNVVLVGDPRQLAQPVKGAHPRGSDRSCLEHVIGERAVVAPERGIFLATTFRMHPDLARFVSDAIYDGRLEADPGCANRRLVLPADRDVHGAIGPAGLGFAELSHVGCTQRSEPEADEIARLYADLLACRVVDRDGVERAMVADDIVVVAPYNVQVNLLRSRLAPFAGDASPRVGTVDKFQGQEAEVSIVSMTTSDAESMPRDASFLLSPNRLNVAVSRARCLAVIVASGGLLDLDARSVEEMRLANLLCRARAEAHRAVATDGAP